MSDYGRTWRTGPDEPRVQLELEYRRRALERVEPRAPRTRTLMRTAVRAVIDGCVRLRRALPWAA